MGIEARINTILQRLPYAKKIVKRLYQSVFVLLSRNRENLGNLVQLTPNDGNEYFFLDTTINRPGIYLIDMYYVYRQNVLGRMLPPQRSL